MTVAEIKSELHKLIEDSQDANLLASIRDVLHHRVQQKQGDLWKALTPAQQKEVLEAFEQSKDPSNLVDHQVVREKYSKWLDD